MFERHLPCRANEADSSKARRGSGLAAWPAGMEMDGWLGGWDVDPYLATQE